MKPTLRSDDTSGGLDTYMRDDGSLDEACAQFLGCVNS